MEIAIAVFIGVWLSGFALWGYLRLKKDYKDVNMTKKDGNEDTEKEVSR